MLVLGIDVGSYSIKVAILASSSRGYELLGFEDYPLSLDPTRDKEIERLDILKTVHSRFQAQNPKWVFGVAQDRVSIRLKSFPFKERFKIQKSLPFEMEDDVPFSQDDAIFDAKITRYVGAQSEVLGLACPKTHIQSAIQWARDAGIEPDILSIEGLALANLFEKWQEPPPSSADVSSTDEATGEKTVMAQSSEEPAEVILDLGHRKTVVMVRRKDVLIEVAVVPWGGFHLIQAVGNKFGIHYIEAAKELHLRGQILMHTQNASADQVNMSTVIQSQVEILAQRIQLILMSLKAAHNLKYEQIATVGGLSQLKGINGFLTQKLEVATNRLKQVAAHPQVQFSDAKFVSSGVAIGLGIEALKRPINPPIDLLKGDFAKQNLSLQMFWARWKFPIQVGISAFVLLFVYSAIRDSLATSLEEQSSDLLLEKGAAITGMKKSQLTPERIDSFLSKQKAMEENLKYLEEMQKVNSPLDVLKRISEVIPKNNFRLNVKTFSVNNHLVKIEGDVSPASGVNQVLTYLKSVATKGQVSSIKSSHPTSPGATSFAFQFQYNRREN